MREDRVRNLIQTAEVKAVVANLQKTAGQVNVTLPRDVALYIAQNVRSNERELQRALIRLMAHSAVTGTEITLAYAQGVLKDFIDARGRKGTVDPFQKLLYQKWGAKQAKVRPEDLIAADSRFSFCLQKTRDAEKTGRVRCELEVNMRESERERLARRDGYERDLERPARKRNQD